MNVVNILKRDPLLFLQLYNNKIFIANVGDSRAVLYFNNKIRIKTREHKPTNKEEFKRIFNSGFNVLNGRINEDLNLSRAFGNFRYKNNNNLERKNQALIVDPDIYIKEFSYNIVNGFLLLGSDGLFDIANPEKLSYYISLLLKMTNNIYFICNRLIDYALLNGSKDNITVTIIRLGYVNFDTSLQNEDKEFNKMLTNDIKRYLDKLNFNTFINSRELVKTIFQYFKSKKYNYILPIEFKYYLIKKIVLNCL